MTENGPELKFKYSVDVEDFKKGNQEVKNEVRSIGPEVQKAGGFMKGYSDLLGKAAAIGSGVFATAMLAVGKAVYSANEQVKNLTRAVEIASGSQEAYARNTSILQGIADKYHKSIFALAGGFTTLTRETRGTINEGARTQQIFDQLTTVSGKLGYTVDTTTDHLSGFIDKMKQGTVDSTGLTDELDKRLYEAFIKVADGMGVTAAELNEVLKESDDAVNTVLPALTRELSNALGDVPQKDAQDLGDKVEYAQSKLTMLLDGLFSTSGAKSALAGAAEDAGGLLDVLDKINRQHGIMAAGGAALTSGAFGVVNAATGLNLDLDPFGYKSQVDAQSQRAAIGSGKYIDGNAIPWMQKESSKFNLPSQKDFDIAGQALAMRAEAEQKANEKLIAENKKQAAERKRALDEINRREIQESNQRIRDGIIAAELAVAEKYTKFNGTLGNVKQADMSGIQSYYKGFGDLDFQQLSNTSASGNTTNYDHITAQINNMSQAWWNEKAAKDASNASSAELSLGLEGLNKELAQIEKQGKLDIFSGIAEGLGEIMVNTGEIENVGAKLGAAFGGMIAQTGKAIITYGITMEGVQKALAASFTNPTVALVVGAAAVMAGSALKAAATKSQSDSFDRKWTGGIADGAMGIDKVPTMLTAGEMVLTGHDQRNLYGFLSGSMPGSLGSNFAGSSGNGRGRTRIEIHLESELRGSTIYQANRRGGREQKYFE